MRIDRYIQEVRKLCKEFGIEGNDLNRLTGLLANVFSQHNERIVEAFEKELNKEMFLSSDAQERNEAILTCIGIVERKTGLVLSKYTIAPE
jgi:hypothetical protein